MGRKPKAPTADTVPFPVFAFKRAETAMLAVNAIARKANRHKWGNNRFRIVRYISEHIRDNGYAPTQMEMAAHFGWSQSYIKKELRFLETLGYVKRSAKTRGIQVLRLPKAS